MLIPVRPGPSGTVLVGLRPPAPTGTGMVQLAGADVHVDPTAPDDPPFALVHDPDDGVALAALYGDAVADAVGLVAGGGDPVSVDAVEGPAAAAVRRLALVSWLERCSPDGLSAALLDAEAGAAAAGLDDLLDACELTAGRDRLLRSAPEVVRLARSIREAIVPPPAGVVTTIAASLRHTLDLLPPGDPLTDDVEHEIASAGATGVSPPEGGTVDWDALIRSPELGTRVLVDGLRSVLRDGEARRDSVDWAQIPRGLLGTGEDTVTWRLLDGGDRVAVSVPALPGLDGGARLAFRLQASTHPLPIAVGALRLGPDLDRFDGTAQVHGTPSGDLVLDVYDPRTARPALTGADRISARAGRWAARAVTALRLAGAAADDAASDALDEAAIQFDRVAMAHPVRAARDRARRQAARCRAVEDAVRERAGDPYPFDDEPVLPPVGPADVRRPDLSGPGWRPSAAEEALGTGL